MRHAIEFMERKVKESQEVMSEFQDGISKNPHYAMSWGDRAVIASARLFVFNEVLGALDTRRENHKPITLRELVEHVADRVTQMAGYPSRSTSPLGNYVTQCELQAWAELREALKRDELEANP